MKAGDRFEFEGVTYELHPNMIQILTEETSCECCDLGPWEACMGRGTFPGCGDETVPADQQFIFKRVPDPIDPRQLNLFPSDSHDPTSAETHRRTEGD